MSAHAPKCPTAKRTYATPLQALSVLVRCRAKGRPEKDYYLCSHGPHYHLTSQRRDTIGLGWNGKEVVRVAPAPGVGRR